MDRPQEQSGGVRKRLLSSPCPAQLSQRREHLSHLLSRHVALIDEIQRSAKELTSGQDEYIASQIDQLRQAAHEVHRAAAPEPITGSGGRSGPWSAEHPGSHSPRSSNDEALFHHTAQKDGTSKPVPTPQLPHPMLPQASSGCLPESVPRLNSCMSCDELLSMLDSVTNPGAVPAELQNQAQGVSSGGGDGSGGGGTRGRINNNKDTAGGSPISRPRKRAIRDTSTSDGPDVSMPLPPPALRNYNNSNANLNNANLNGGGAVELTPHNQPLLFSTATPTPPAPIPAPPAAVSAPPPQVQHVLSTGGAPAPAAALQTTLPRGHGSMPHLVAPHQSDMLAPSPFTTMAPPPQQMAPQVYHTHHHHHTAPLPQQQQHYTSAPMMNGPPHSHSHLSLPQHLQQQQQHYSSAPLPMHPSAPVRLPSYPPPPPPGGIHPHRQMVNGPPPLQPPMRQMSPYTMMGMSMAPPSSMATAPPPLQSWPPMMPHPHSHLRMNGMGALPPLPHPLPHHLGGIPAQHHRHLSPAPTSYMQAAAVAAAAAKVAMMGPPSRRGPLGLTGVASQQQLFPPHPVSQYARPGMPMAPSPPPSLMSMHAAAAAFAAAPVAVNAFNNNMPGGNGANTNTIPVPASLPPVRVTPPAAADAAAAAVGGTKEKESSLLADGISLPPMPPAQLLADLPSLSPCGLLSPGPGGLGDQSTLSSLALPPRDKDTTTTTADPFQDINHIHLSPEEFDAVLAAFDTPGLEDAQT